MALNPQYIPLYNLQQYFVDKTTGAPLSAGLVYFYSDINRTNPKTVYELSSTTGTYTYVPLPNPVILSSVGTPVDNNGNDIVIYAFPFDDFGNPELYYVVVQDHLGRPQLTREAVPSSASGGTPGSDANVYNYIPNGQFLAHTDVPSADHTLVAGVNVIAQGGFSIILSDPLNSINTLEFIPQGFTEVPPQSPRYLAEFTAQTASGSDTIKNLQIRFNDVNKFSANNDFYTFAFWAEATVNVPIAIQIVKYFGTTGSPMSRETIFTDTITTEMDVHQYQFQFGTNEGQIVDLVDNNDYVAIEIAMPLDFTFTVEFADFVLANGQILFTSFPLQTNADMITRGVDGWTDVPAYNGYDLYLPKVLTRYGYKYDTSSIGMGGFTFAEITSPLSTSPLPETNIMALDGASYIYSDYSTLGIPFARLGDFLFNNSPITNVPLFGTGSNYATCYGNSNPLFLRLTVNSNGVGVPAATNGSNPVPFGVSGFVDYNGSNVGSNSLNYVAYSSGSATNQIICRANFSPQLPNNNYCFAGTSGFTITPFDWFTGLYAQQDVAFTIDTVNGAALVQGAGNPGLYFDFYNDAASTTGYYMWFNVNGEVDPGPGIPGTLPIELGINSTDTAQDVANAVREAMNAYQISLLNFFAVPTSGQFFLFSTNPGAIRNFYVWYEVDNIGSDPLVPGAVGIKVATLSSDNAAAVAVKTQIAINKFQYGIIDARGMFLRNQDSVGEWDFDYLTRFSNVTGITGPTLGSMEYGQLISHNHELITGDLSALFPANFEVAYTNPWLSTRLDQDHILNTGGTETRPVNMYVNYFIRY